MNERKKRIVSVKHLRQCRLWPGSSFELSFRYGGVTLAECKKKYEQLCKIDDPTPSEIELRHALYLTIEENPS